MAKYRIEIDGEACVGDALCSEELPSTFGLDDESIAVVLDESADDPEKILEVAQSCPMDAIVLVDTETGKKIWPED